MNVIMLNIKSEWNLTTNTMILEEKRKNLEERSKTKMPMVKPTKKKMKKKRMMKMRILMPPNTIWLQRKKTIRTILIHLNMTWALTKKQGRVTKLASLVHDHVTERQFHHRHGQATTIAVIQNTKRPLAPVPGRAQNREDLAPNSVEADPGALVAI